MPEDVAYSIHDLLADAQLKSIEVLEIWARRSEGEPVSELEPKWDVGIDNRTDDHGFRVRVNLDLDFGNGDVGVCLGLAYETNEIATTAIPVDVMQQFVNDVAVMAAVPYVRQHITDLTVRIYGTPTIIPIMLRGQIEFTLERGEVNSDYVEPIVG
ncbi:hypothetical protein BH10PLA2_BH10PLA2_01680 [soil metagenome]